MRCALAMIAVLLVTDARSADPAAKAFGTLDGKAITFPEEGIADGVKATVGLLESCHHESEYKADDLVTAKKGDHICMTFAEPITIRVRNEKIEVSELVFRRPLNTGLFWVRTGTVWRGFTKYEFKKTKPFETWLETAQPVK